MRAKWRKAIWAILALQLLLWHLLFLENNMWLDYSVNRVVNYFGLSYLLYLYWKSLDADVLETGLHGGKGGRSFLYQSKEVREPLLIGFKEPILILPIH